MSAYEQGFKAAKEGKDLDNDNPYAMAIMEDGRPRINDFYEGLLWAYWRDGFRNYWGASKGLND